MSEQVAGHNSSAAGAVPGLREMAREITGYWWMPLVGGIAWIVAALVILQFDSASVTTVGVLVGLLFAGSAVQNFSLAAAAPGAMRWFAAIFGGLFAVAALICFVEPQGTFAGLADTLGFLFGVIGVWWMVRAFLERIVNPLWWLGLISGILMTTLAFWTAGQFFIQKAYVLLVFAGLWALMQGINDITRALATREVHDAV